MNFAWSARNLVSAFAVGFETWCSVLASAGMVEPALLLLLLLLLLVMARLGSIIGDASAMKPRGLTVEASACSVDAC